MTNIDLSGFVQAMENANSVEEKVKILEQLGIALKLWPPQSSSNADWTKLFPYGFCESNSMHYQIVEIFRSFAMDPAVFDAMMNLNQTIRSKMTKIISCGGYILNNNPMLIFACESSPEIIPRQIYEFYSPYANYAMRGTSLLSKLSRDKLRQVIVTWWNESFSVHCFHRPIEIQRFDEILYECTTFDKTKNAFNVTEQDSKNIFEMLETFRSIFILKHGEYNAPIRDIWPSNCKNMVVSIAGAVRFYFPRTREEFGDFAKYVSILSYLFNTASAISHDEAMEHPFTWLFST